MWHFLLLILREPLWIGHAPLSNGDSLKITRVLQSLFNGKMTLFFLNLRIVYFLWIVSNKFPFKLILKTDFITGRPKITASDAENLSGGVKRNSAGEEKTVSSRVDYNHWSHGLLASMKNPEFKVLENEDHVVIKVCNWLASIFIQFKHILFNFCYIKNLKFT